MSGAACECSTCGGSFRQLINTLRRRAELQSKLVNALDAGVVSLDQEEIDVVIGLMTEATGRALVHIGDRDIVPRKAEG